MNHLQRYLMTRRANEMIKRRSDPLYTERLPKFYFIVLAAVVSLICLNCTRF